MTIIDCTRPRGSGASVTNLPEPDPWWAAGARRAIEVLAASRALFTADDLFEDPIALSDPPHPSHIGSAFAAAKVAGLIVAVGYSASTRPSRNGGVHRTWTAGPAVAPVGGDVA